MKNARIFSIIKKPSVTCSNVFILNIGGYRVIIDTGATQDTMDKICNVLDTDDSGGESPVIIIFGHAHFDHLYQGIVDRRLASFGNTVYICHRAAEEPLKEGNAEYIQASLVDLPVPCFNIDIPVFSPQKEKKGIIGENLPGFCMISKEYAIHGSIPLIAEEMIFPDGQSLVFWEVPGHSPDSMAIQAGNLIHVGDIPFATNPGVAGLIGYNPQELLRTVHRIRWIMQEEPISVICSGHGNPLSPEIMQKLLSSMERDLGKTPEIAVFDKKRVDISMLHAMDLMEEAHRILPVLAGRIMVLRYHLEELEECELADKLGEIIRDDEIDQVLLNFTAFYNDFQNGEKREIEVVLKTLQVLQKIRSYLPKQDMEWIIDMTLLRRCEHLFSDLLSTIQGILPSASHTPCNPVTLIHDLVQNRNRSKMSDEELLESGDNKEIFQKVLVCRLSEYQSRTHSEIEIKNPGISVIMSADVDRLYDFFSAVIDHFEANNAGTISFDFKTEGDNVLISVVPDSGCRPDLPLSPAFIRTIGYAGGEVKKLATKENEEIILAFRMHHPA